MEVELAIQSLHTQPETDAGGVTPEQLAESAMHSTPSTPHGEERCSTTRTQERPRRELKRSNEATGIFNWRGSSSRLLAPLGFLMRRKLEVLDHYAGTAGHALSAHDYLVIAGLMALRVDIQHHCG